MRVKEGTDIVHGMTHDGDAKVVCGQVQSTKVHRGHCGEGRIQRRDGVQQTKHDARQCHSHPAAAGNTNTTAESLDELVLEDPPEEELLTQSSHKAQYDRCEQGQTGSVGPTHQGQHAALRCSGDILEGGDAIFHQLQKVGECHQREGGQHPHLDGGLGDLDPTGTKSPIRRPQPFGNENGHHHNQRLTTNEEYSPSRTEDAVAIVFLIAAAAAAGGVVTRPIQPPTTMRPPGLWHSRRRRSTTNAVVVAVRVVQQ
jgi:hypothetical protein